ncbi:uncharacterized protein [Maniola hyperantus]|uniref:uncharacterized protein isoform X2 n=1 Tax=Aphantopus hyperantus TaxID=2795564 RepID=UPI001569144E|nr:synaptic defective enhancer 1-like [Maniola hyperantus]
MSSRAGSIGYQPPQSGQLAPNESNDVTNAENVERQKDFCRDYIWGACTKGNQCKFRHELEFEVMKKTLKFCHDYQNSTGCAREHCTYLHASKEEQSLFTATGQLPQCLVQRHANMSAGAAETIPQIALYIQESLAGAHQPPPPPPPASASVHATIAPPPTYASVYPRPPVASVASVAPCPAPVMPVQQLPPPPPPPTVPSTYVRQQAPVFTAPPPAQVFAMPQAPPPMVPMYDASKPPPPIMPTHVQLKSEPKKRQASNEDLNARPTKVRKSEEAKNADALCEQCVQKELRIEAIRKDLDAGYEEEEYETLMYKKKFDEYQNLKEILKSLISTDLFQRFFEENVERIPQNQFHNIFSQAPFSAGVSTVPNQFLLQLMDYVMTDARNVDLTPSASLRIDESLIQALSSLPRKANPVKIIYNAGTTHNNNNNTNHTNAPPEVLQTFMDILRQFNSSDKSPPSEPSRDFNKSPSTSNNTTNGSHQYSNRQQDIPMTVSSSRFPPPPGPGMHGIATSTVYAPQVAPAPQPYQPYQPMPPAGLYYPPPFAAPPTGMQMAPETQAMRAHVPVTMAPAPPPPAPLAPAAPPVVPPMYQPSHYAIGRYPPPYYPRHQ